MAVVRGGGGGQNDRGTVVEQRKRLPHGEQRAPDVDSEDLDALSRGTRSISELAFAIGYRSESAFSTAFRRVTGFSPRQFRQVSNPAE
ncbi:helix-turn-helix domain-containing protein [Streptomyces malaysiensis]|uniref:helix-turn-helix domain-containing protein n=1 Tax=Streptomyces malaysiensis TaxID=92644 RepID=UPI0011AFE15D